MGTFPLALDWLLTDDRRIVAHPYCPMDWSAAAFLELFCPILGSAWNIF
jgi:hypothetical protein